MLLISSWGGICPHLLALMSCSCQHLFVDAERSLHLLVVLKLCGPALWASSGAISEWGPKQMARKLTTFMQWICLFFKERDVSLLLLLIKLVIDYEVIFFIIIYRRWGREAIVFSRITRLCFSFSTWSCSTNSTAVFFCSSSMMLVYLKFIFWYLLMSAFLCFHFFVSIVLLRLRGGRWVHLEDHPMLCTGGLYSGSTSLLCVKLCWSMFLSRSAMSL